MAIPTSAMANAAASLTPSPIIATVAPSCCNFLTKAAFSSGLESASTLVIPTSLEIVEAVSTLSPVNIITWSPKFFAFEIAKLVVSLNLSFISIQPISFSPLDTKTTVVPVAKTSAKSLIVSETSTPLLSMRV